MSLINIVLWILFGALAGWIASKIMGTDAQMGAGANILIGIVGAVVGGFLVGLFGISTAGFSIASLLVAVLGAVVLIFLIGALQRA